MSSDNETIMPSDVGAKESSPQANGSSENGSSSRTTKGGQGGAPSPSKSTSKASTSKVSGSQGAEVEWATSHFEVMMGQPLYGALLDAETEDLITQVRTQDGASIHDLRKEGIVSGEVLYLTQDENGKETRIELSLKTAGSTGGVPTGSEAEKLIGALRDEILNSGGDESRGPAPDADKEDLWDQIETLRDRLTKMRDKNQDLLDEIDNAEGKLRKVRNEKRGEIAQLRDKREELRVENQQLKRERDKLKREVQNKEGREEELEEKLTTMRDRNDRLKSRVANVSGEDDGTPDGFWAMLFERLLGEDGMLSEVDGTAISRVMAQLSQQQAQDQPQQVPGAAMAQMQGAAGPGGGAASPVQRAGQQRASQQAAQGQRQQAQAAQAQSRQAQSPQSQSPQVQSQEEASRAAGQENSEGQPQQAPPNQPEEMMDRDEAVADLFKRIIEDSIGRLQGAVSEAEIQKSSKIVGQRLDEYRSQQGFQIQPHEWAQLMWELTAAVDRMDLEEEVGQVFCSRLWPMLLTFSDQLQVVNYMPADQAATTLQNFYESSDTMLLGNRIEITGSMHQKLTGVIAVLKSHLGSGERPEDPTGESAPEDSFSGEQNDTPPGL